MVEEVPTPKREPKAATFKATRSVTKSAEKAKKRPATAKNASTVMKFVMSSAKKEAIVEEPRFMMPAESAPVLAVVAQEEVK